MKREKICVLLILVFVLLFAGVWYSNNAEAKGKDRQLSIEDVQTFPLNDQLIESGNEPNPVESADVIISDEVFADSETMTEVEIQAFLEAHDSFLMDYIVPPADYHEWEGENYYEGTWIGPSGHEVDATGWSASKVINNVAQWYDINPQVLLTTLQKESSLITDNPIHHGIIQWSMGFAYTESGIEGACGTETNHNPTGSCAGFVMQVDWAGARLKDWLNWSTTAYPDAMQYVTGSTIEIDGQPVKIQNGAEAALYRYTPHVQTSFKNIYTQWFAS